MGSTRCVAGSASARCSTSYSAPFVAERAEHWWCAVNPVSERRRCSTTRLPPRPNSWSPEQRGRVETELAFAALQRVCAPILDRVVRLPGPQREALEVAFGLKNGPPPDPFMIGLGVIELLSEAADAQPLLCLIDSEQLLDDASAQSLAFVARRLLAEPVAMVFATTEIRPELAGLPELHVTGLRCEDARALLVDALPAPLDEHVLTASSPRPAAIRWRFSSYPRICRLPSSPAVSDFRRAQRWHAVRRQFSKATRSPSIRDAATRAAGGCRVDRRPCSGLACRRAARHCPGGRNACGRSLACWNSVRGRGFAIHSPGRPSTVRRPWRTVGACIVRWPR